MIRTEPNIAGLTPVPIHEICTPRLLLRQWKTCDLASLAALHADPDVMRFFPSVLSQDESDAMAHRCRALIDERGWGFWAVEERATGDFIGLIGLHTPAAHFPFSPCVEVGWRLARSHWGQGLATEGAQAAVQFGFEQLKLSEIVSFTSVHNFKSQAVMQRLGMRRDPATFAHPAVGTEHWLNDHCLYRIQSPNGQSRGT